MCVCLYFRCFWFDTVAARKSIETYRDERNPAVASHLADIPNVAASLTCRNKYHMIEHYGKHKDFGVFAYHLIWS